MNQEWTFAVTQVLSVIQPSEMKFFEEAVMCKEKFRNLSIKSLFPFVRATPEVHEKVIDVPFEFL